MCDNARMAIPVVFMGSAPISCEFLRALEAARDLVELRLVVTRPNKENGRRVQECAVRQIIETADDAKTGERRKAWEKENKKRQGRGEPPLPPLLRLDCFQPKTFRTKATDTEEARQLVAEARRRVAACDPQVVVVVAYGNILPEEVLAIPPLGCLNIHMSLLPALRGPAPINCAILNGLQETGVTAMQMNAKCDEGPVYAQRTVAIRPGENAGELTDELTREGIPLMLDTLRALADGTAVATPQDHSRATFSTKFCTSTCWEIDWSKSAEEIERLVCAFSPKPACTAYLPPSADFHGQPVPFDPLKCKSMEGPLIKISGVEIVPDPAPANAQPSQIVAIEKSGVVVAAGDGRCLRLTKVRPFGKANVLSGADFVNGFRNRLKVGDMLWPFPQWKTP